MKIFNTDYRVDKTIEIGGRYNEKTDPRKVAYKQFDDPLEINKLNALLRKYFFIDYYDTSNINETEFIEIVSLYNSYNQYLKDKINAKELIDAGRQLPKELEHRLLTTKTELEKANKFRVYGTV